MIKRLLLVALALTPLPALAQNAQTPGGQTVPGAVLMCPTGQVNADGATVVAPCGSNTNPTKTVIAPGSAPVSTVVTAPVPGCPANPISKKTPPLC